MTLHAAITAEIARHLMVAGADVPICSCRQAEWDPAHVTDRVLAVLADRLPHTTPDQLAGLIGGTVDRAINLEASDHIEGPGELTFPGDEERLKAWAASVPVRFHQQRVTTPWVPDSPPAAPEPRQDT